MFRLFEINSIRSRMVTGFLFLTFLILVLAVVSLFLFDRITSIVNTHSNISQLEIYTLNLINTDNDFFDLETINPNYFKTHQSRLLERRDTLNRKIAHEIQELTENRADYGNVFDQNLHGIDSTLKLYNAKFQVLEELVFKKGFKDYGIEGAMRFHAHSLEALCPAPLLPRILYLRRHEKDFLLRSDTAYLTLFTERSHDLKAEMERQHAANADALHHLTEYHGFFLALAHTQQQLGLSSTSGLRNELNILTHSLSDQYYTLSDLSYSLVGNAYHNSRIFYLLMLGGALLFSLLSGYWISKRLSAPIARLSKLVNEAILNKSGMTTDFNLKNAATEVNMLTGSFILLMNQTKIQLKEINEKSHMLRSKNKELKKVNRELDNFLYSTAHDLRSPLSSLLGLINLIRYENKQPELGVYFDMMEKSIHRSESFISQIVNFSQNKKMAVLPERLDIEKLIREIFESHQFVEGSSQIEKNITITGSVPLYTDRNRITILFNNLISNAIKYADLTKHDPFIRIDITLQPTHFFIDFIDNGVGIDPEHIGNIFEMFYRANTSSKGTGLGLFIFKETLARMNGAVVVESSPGVGTTFKIRLPNLTESASALPPARHAVLNRNSA